VVKETNSGVRKEGSWKEISEFAEKALQALQDSDVDEKYVKEYREWRPKQEEREEDFKEKTAKDATLAHKKIEDKSNGVKEDLGDASKQMARAGKKAAKKEKPKKEVKKAFTDVFDMISAKIIGFTRKMERLLYSKVMMRFNPYFFDTEEFSADVRRKKDGGYSLEIDMPREKPRKQIKDKLKEE